jgi:hypothetical protein
MAAASEGLARPALPAPELERRRALQCAPALLLVRPAAPAGNPETAGSNSFQARSFADAALGQAARRQFEHLVAALAAADVATLVLDEPKDDGLPDSVFPNNWFSTHDNGDLVLYPLLSPLRRRERRPAFINAIERAVAARRILDWSPSERQGLCLEGTGSLIPDRIERLVYAALSPRTERSLVERWADHFGYRAVCFEAVHRGQPIYHTNVLLSLGARLALVCPSVCAPSAPLLARLRESGRTVIELSADQMEAFAANVLEVRRSTGGSAWVLSARARAALQPEQVELLAADGPLVVADLGAIETLGGGSARCMLAELWPRA